MSDINVFRAIMFLRTATKLREINTIDEAVALLHDNGVLNVDVKLDHLVAPDGEAWAWAVTVGVLVPDQIDFSWAVVGE